MRFSKAYPILVLLFMGCTQNKGANMVQPPTQKPPIDSSQLVKFNSQKEFDSKVDELAKSEKVSVVGSFGANTGGSPDMASPSISSNQPNINNAPITNNQEREVDEGGVVKNYKDFLVILRHGKLITTKVLGTTQLSLISNISVTPDGLDNSVWYDELLIHDNLAVVIGYRWHNFEDYMRGLTELNFFRIDETGVLTRVDTRFIESSDYYSWRNYSGRLVNGRLVFYMPYSVFRYTGGKKELNIPHVYKYLGEGKLELEGPLFSGTDVYKPVQEPRLAIFHTLVSCDLNGVPFSCRAESILADWEREHYVSPTRAYLWVSYSDNEGILYSMELDGSQARHMVIPVIPYDQFSFSETKNGLSLFGYPFNDKGECSKDKPLVLAEISPSSDIKVHCLPQPTKNSSMWLSWSMVNRFSPTHLVYGNDKKLLVVDRNTQSVSSFDLPYRLERLELAGSSMLSVGMEGSSGSVKLGISALELSPDPKLGVATWVTNSLQGEWRSHGFNYRGDEQAGVFGLATIPYETGLSHWNESAEISLFNLDKQGVIKLIDTIHSKTFAAPSENCITSCIDWYGNTRAIFLEDAIFGLMGDQLTHAILEKNGQLKVHDHLNVNTGEVIVE